MTFAQIAQGFAPTGRYFEIAEGHYKWRAGEAYKFLEWDGVAIRVIGTEMKDIVVCSLDQVREISKEEYNRAEIGTKGVGDEHKVSILGCG